MKPPEPTARVTVSPGEEPKPGSPLFEALADLLADAIVTEVQQRRLLAPATVLSPRGSAQAAENIAPSLGESKQAVR